MYKSPSKSYTCVQNYIKFLLHIRRSLDSFHSNTILDDAFPDLPKNSFEIFLGHVTSKTPLIPISDSFSFSDPKICKLVRPRAFDQSQIPFEESKTYSIQVKIKNILPAYFQSYFLVFEFILVTILDSKCPLIRYSIDLLIRTPL